MITLNQGQQDALSSAMKFLLSPGERHMVIKGRAGTGKSTLVETLVPAIEKHAKVVALLLQQSEALPIYLTATTNKAAKVLSDITNCETTTIHSLLGLMVRSDWSTGETKLTRRADSQVIENAVILIDEAFYIDPQLQQYIEQGTKNCKIIFIGDPYQCAPIRQTHSPIQDLTCRTEELTQVMRNKGALTLLGEHWRDVVISGQFSRFTLPDSNIIFTQSAAEFQHHIDSEFSNNTADENKNKILAWTNNQSAQYSHHVRMLRGLPNEFTEGEYLQINSGLPKKKMPTDTIIRIKKFYAAGTIHGIQGRHAELYRGEDLFIPNSAKDYQDKLKEYKANKNWKSFFEVQETIPDLRAIHSCTVHKGQGSTYENVFIDLPDIGACNIASDVARMMHVAVTRASSKVIFRGKLPDKYGG